MSQAMDRKKAKVAAFLEGLLQRLPGDGPYPAHYLGWYECFNTQHYYEAHDVLEALWHQGGRAHPEFAFYKGLIQIAGAFVHMRLHREEPDHPVHGRRLDPACRLFELAEANLGQYPGAHLGLDVGATRELCRRYREAIRASGDTDNPWTPQGAPRFPFPDPRSPARPVGGLRG